MVDQPAEDVWADLIIAMLSVNNYPLDKTYALAESLKESGLLSPEVLAAWGPAEVSKRLARAGYNRGPVLNGMLAERLCSLGVFVGGIGRSQCEPLLRRGEQEAVSRLLSAVKGVGPTVLRSYFILRGDPPARRTSPS